MKRKLMMVERIMYADAATPVNCVFTAKIRGSISLENLQAALHKIQRKHPLLRVFIDETERGRPYFISNNNIGQIPVRIVERYSDDDWLTISKEEWFKLFTDKNLPLARLVWLKSAGVSELLLIMPHCICDGSTCVALMREILSLLDDPQKKLNAYSTFHSVLELIPPTFDKIKGKRKARMISFLGKIFFLFKSTRNKAGTGDHYILHWKLTEEQTQAIAEACKGAATTVHAALCVAFLNAFRQVQGAKAKGKVISPVDIRRFIPEIKEDTMFAFAPIAELNIEKKNVLDFWILTRKFKTDLTAKIESMNAYEMLWVGEFMHSMVNRMIRVLRATEGSHDITLSNMGKINMPETYNSFFLETIYSPTVAFPWRNSNTLLTTTFKGRMDFSFISNESFLQEQKAVKIKSAAMEILLASLPQLTHA